MAAVTRLGLYGGSRTPYSFAKPLTNLVQRDARFQVKLSTDVTFQVKAARDAAFAQTVKRDAQF